MFKSRQQLPSQPLTRFGVFKPSGRPDSNRVKHVDCRDKCHTGHVIFGVLLRSVRHAEAANARFGRFGRSDRHRLAEFVHTEVDQIDARREEHSQKRGPSFRAVDRFFETEVQKTRLGHRALLCPEADQAGLI